MKPFLTIEEVARLLGMDYKTVYRLVLSGQLPALKIGAVYRIRQGDLDRFLESQLTSSRAGEADASSPEVGSCGRCGLAFRVPSLVAGKCQEPGCDAPLCTGCWQRVTDRFCADHTRPERVEGLEQARERHRRGELPLLVEADAARERELTFISRFDQAVRRLPGLTSPWDRSWIPVKDWAPLRREEASLLPGEGGPVVVRYGRGRRALPRNLTSFYYLAGDRKAAFALGAASFSHVATYLDQGFDTAPSTRTELLHIVDNALDLVRSRGMPFVLGLASPTGWEPEAEEVVLGSATAKGFSHADLLLLLVDLYQDTIRFNPADQRLAPLADLFLGELEEETLQRVANLLRQELLLRESLSLAEASRVAQAPETVILKAFARLQSQGGYHMDWVKGLGNVLSKG